MAENIWVRPDHIEHPKKWIFFKGRIPIEGKTPEFWIEDMHDDQKDEVFEHLMAGFNDEPLCRYSRIIEDQVSMGEVRESFRELLNNKMTLVCMTMDKTGKPIIAGISCLSRTAKTDAPKVPTGEVLQNIRGMMTVLYERVNPYSFLNMDEYLMDRGIFVLPDFRRQGICYNFLLTWITICKEVGQRAIVGMFTSIYSQRAAVKAGYGNMISMRYIDFEKINEKFKLPGISEHTTNIQVLYKRV